MGFVRNQIDPCVYKFTRGHGRAILTVYVDDILAMAENEVIRHIVKSLLGRCLELKHVGEISHMLGVKFEKRTNIGFALSQKAYIDQLINRFGLQDAKGTPTPMKVIPNFLEEEDNTEDCPGAPYRELICELLYLSQRTRPDIAFAVAKLAQFCSSFNKQHWIAAKRILGYVKETKHHKIVYRLTGQPVSAYTDADWATCSRDRKSTSVVLITLAGAPVNWKSAKQTAVVLSNMEAEYISLAACAREVTWMKELLRLLDLGDLVKDSTLIWSDSQAAIAHATNYVDKSSTKHIAIKHHFIRERVMDGTIHLRYVPTNQNPAIPSVGGGC